MRKILIIALITVHLFGNTELSQLFKIPSLIAHYFQHHRQDPAISFLKFLEMHYGGDDGTKADDSEDSKLPCHSFCHSFSISFTSLLKNSLQDEGIIQDQTKEYGNRLDNGNPSEHVLLILQPPRFA